MKLKAKTKGALLILFSAFSFAWMSTFVFLAGEIPFFQKALFRNGVALLIAGSSMVVSKRTLSVPPPCRLALVSRVLCGSVSVFCNFYAIDQLLLASSNSLNKLAPFFAIVLAACFLGERIGRRQAVCMAVAFAGSLFLIVPSLDTRGLPCLIALIGAATSGGAFVSLRALQRVGILAPSVIVFFFSLTTTTIALVPSVLFWTPMRAQQLLFLLLAGMACAIGQFALTYAYRYAAPREISLCDCTQIVFSGILGFYILDQVPSGESLIAYVLIVAASAMLLCSREPMRTSGAE